MTLIDVKPPVPDTARLHKEEAGVRWYIDGEGVNAMHHMVFDGRVFSGNWVGPKAVFKTLVLMGEERQTYSDDDKLIGAITRWVHTGKLVKAMRGEQ
jgi:hypothetical protein